MCISSICYNIIIITVFFGLVVRIPREIDGVAKRVLGDYDNTIYINHHLFAF